MARTRRKRPLESKKWSKGEDDQVPPPKKLLFEALKQAEMHTSEDKLNLCSRCHSIDFEAIFKLDPKEISSEGATAFDLGYMNLAEPASSCEFCGMVAQILSQNRLVSDTVDKSSVPCHLRAFSCLSVLGFVRTQRRLAQSPSIVIAAVPSPSEARISIQMRDASLATGVILPTVNSDSDCSQSLKLSYIGRRIHPDSIDFNVLAAWLRDCSSEHKICIEYEELMRADGGSDYPDIPDLLVIDTETRLMTRLPPGKSYVAMSYVWGSQMTGSSVAAVHEGDKLPYPQPTTVEDVLIVVRNIGERFLWLDRYSIDQADILAKQKAILNMANIFENAALTIVSLAPNVDAGLWGVSSAPRRSQPTAVCGGLQLVGSGLVLEDVIQKSIWSKRCWTLQEALLTRKMLIFSEDQVYWKCSTITQVESVEQPHTAALLSRKTIRHPNLELFSEASVHRKRFGEMPLPVYTREVAEYTKRELTYSSDALNAFRAILSRSGETTFYGIPIYMTRDADDNEGRLTDTGFLLGLLWSRSAHQWFKPWQEFTSTDRVNSGVRPGFPTWSWTSTPHCIQFDPISFSQKLSDEYGSLFAAVYRHSSYAIAYAKVELPDHDSPARAIEQYYADKHSPYSPGEAAESFLPATLHLTSLIVRWKVDNLKTAISPLAIHVSLQLPTSIPLVEEKDWFRHGTCFLDNDSDIHSAQESGFEGTAVLLIQYRRFGFNWLHVIWWIAIAEVHNGWRRIGLIRSVNEVERRCISARYGQHELELAHRRPFLPLALDSGSIASYPPQKEVLEAHYRTIKLV